MSSAVLVMAGLERVMGFGVSAKVAIAVSGKAHAAGQAGGLAKASNAAWRRDSHLPEGWPACAAAAVLSGLPWTPPKVGAGRLAATTQASHASHPKVHNSLYWKAGVPRRLSGRESREL
jgi:hypothetical protein